MVAPNVIQPAPYGQPYCGKS